VSLKALPIDEVFANSFLTIRHPLRPLSFVGSSPLPPRSFCAPQDALYLYPVLSPVAFPTLSSPSPLGTPLPWTVPLGALLAAATRRLLGSTLSRFAQVTDFPRCNKSPTLVAFPLIGDTVRMNLLLYEPPRLFCLLFALSLYCFLHGSSHSFWFFFPSFSQNCMVMRSRQPPNDHLFFPFLPP